MSHRQQVAILNPEPTVYYDKLALQLLWYTLSPALFVFCFPGGSDSKESACSVGDLGSIPGLGKRPGGGHGNPLQYSCPENPRDRGAWRVHGVTKNWT